MAIIFEAIGSKKQYESEINKLPQLVAVLRLDMLLQDTIPGRSVRLLVIDAPPCI